MKPVLQTIGDQHGPEKMLFLRQPQLDLEAIVVVDNTAAGPAIGGVRMSPSISAEEVFRLARAMTLKNAAAGLPHGGGKAGIVADPGLPQEHKEKLVRTFAQLICDLSDYIPGPDMGTDERCMAWINDEIKRAVGLPRVLGGIPLDAIGATGLGLAVAAEVAAPAAGFAPQGSRLVIQGFGAVGKHAARYLAQRGVKLVAASDSRGGIYHPEGLDIEALIAHKESGQTVMTFQEGRAISHEAVFGIDCDIWIPAAQPDVLTESTVQALKARLILQGANIPASEAAEVWMHGHGILSIPDFIANAGGVICAAVEYRGGSQQAALAAIEEKIRANIRELLERLREKNELPREAAIEMALGRVHEAMSYRKLYSTRNQRGLEPNYLAL